MCRSLAHRA
ncbi:unnamed protein product [Linum tenue]|uniref:Uncharacterized protein n=1 Tax=Linum tenue TaxID=586396 RepID=A0AAV0RKB4_9ROSI|nr:unnamed protein product [Linum tenue]